MTCIVGIVENGNVYIGGDSASVTGHHVNARPHGKVFRVGDFLIGTSGSGRQHQLLRYSWKPPKRKARQDIMEYMVNDVMDSLREHFKTKGNFHKDNELELNEGRFLLGYEGRLFTVWQNYQVDDSLYPFMAVGSGETYAIGALNATEGRLAPLQRLEVALSAAAEFCGSVRPPFTYEVLPASLKAVA